MPLQIELELDNSAEDPIESYLSGTTLHAFTKDNTSKLQQIEDVQTKCDRCQLDNRLQNSYADRLSNGGELSKNTTHVTTKLNRFKMEQMVNKSYFLMVHGN